MSIYERAAKNFERALEFYKADLRALTPEQVMSNTMGKARRACDFTWEVVEVNENIRRRMLGEPPVEGTDEWTVCPDDQNDVEKLATALEEGGQKLLEAFRSLGDEKALQEFETPSGPRTPLEMLFFAYMHTMYHDAQLNLIQGLHGDDSMHWPM
jgi:uncharacterized damage-inducible protein DinB